MFALADAFPVHYVPAPRAAFRARRSNLRPVACSRKLRDELATEHRQIVGLAARHEDVRARGAAPDLGVARFWCTNAGSVLEPACGSDASLSAVSGWADAVGLGERTCLPAPDYDGARPRGRLIRSRRAAGSPNHKPPNITTVITASTMAGSPGTT